MRVLMTGGGSAGHITPILSVASELKAQEPQCHIRYVGQVGDSLGSLATDSGSIDSTWRIFAGKWRRYHGIGFWAHATDFKTIFRNIRDLFLFGIGFLQSFWLLVWWRPNVVFVKGGYVGLPVGLAAAVLRIPIVTHDSDVLPGLTNRILSRFARKQCVGMPPSYYKTYAVSKMVHTGVPLREEYQPVSAEKKTAIRRELKVPVDAKVVAVIGGSLGAVRLNNAIMHICETLLSSDKNIVILHQCGAKQESEVLSFYALLPQGMQSRIYTWAFIPELYKLTAAADVVVTRAGATSMAELGAQQKAAVVVPNPYLVGGHQLHNAQVIAALEVAIVVSEQQLQDESFDFTGVITDLLADTRQRTTLARNLSKMTATGASEKITKVLLGVART